MQPVPAHRRRDPTHSMIRGVSNPRYGTNRFERTNSAASISLVEGQSLCELSHRQSLLMHEKIKRIALSDGDAANHLTVAVAKLIVAKQTRERHVELFDVCRTKHLLHGSGPRLGLIRLEQRASRLAFAAPTLANSSVHESIDDDRVVAQYPTRRRKSPQSPGVTCLHRYPCSYAVALLYRIMERMSCFAKCRAKQRKGVS